MTKVNPTNSLADDQERTTTDKQPQPMCIWASISMWCLLVGFAMLVFALLLDEYRLPPFVVLRCLAICSSFLILFSPVSAIVALVIVKKSRGRLGGVGRAGTCLVLSLMLIAPSIGLSLLNNIRSRNAEILAPFRDGDIVKARELLARKPKIANKRLMWGDSPMHAAASSGHRDLVELLIESRAKIDILSASKDTPLHRAAAAGHVEVVLLLLDKGANIEARYSIGETPLHEAAGAYENSEAVVRLLLERGADPTVEDDFGKTPLDTAGRFNHEEAAKVLHECEKEE